MIQGLVFAGIILAVYAIHWLFKAKGEGVRRLRTVMLFGLAAIGLWMMFDGFGWQATASVIGAFFVVRWIYRGFKSSQKT